MLDRKLIREAPDLVREAIRNRGSDFDVDELIRLDERRRELLVVEQLKAERNRLSKQIGETLKGGGPADDLRAEVNDLKERIGAMETELAEVDALFERRMLEIPNIPLPAVPVGGGEEDNVVVHEGKLSTLKRFKDEVKEVLAGQECGMAFENYQDMRAGDVIECYRVEEVKRTL